MAWRAALAVAMLLAGCTASDVDRSADAPVGDTEARPVVVAIIDAGVNPYHTAFTTAPSSAADSIAAATMARPIELSESGTLAERLESDSDVLRGVARGELIHFAGTPLLGISFAKNGEGDPPIIESGVGHGTPIASILLRDAPGIVVVVVQVQTVVCYVADPPTRCAEFPEIVEAMEWAAAQPWIDIVSISLGLPANAPDPRQETRDFARATHAAAATGMLVVAAGGNEPVPTWSSFSAGPPWVVSVGGWEPNPTGFGSLDTARAPDVVANSTVTAPRADSLTESAQLSGTSFASPVVSATFARALQELRTDPAAPFAEWTPIGTSDAGSPHAFDASRLRAALNASADTVGFPMGVPAMGLESAVSYLQGGWGRIDAGHAEAIVQRIRDSNLDVPDEKQPIAEHQARGLVIRDAFWTAALD